MPRRDRTRSAFDDTDQPVVTLFGQSSFDLVYDYEQIAETDREVVRTAAWTIKSRLKRAAEDIFVIGRELQEVKGRLPYGSYADWLDVEFGLSVRMAQRFVNVSQRLDGRNDIMSFLPPTTLYMLAAPSTPDEAISAIEAKVAAGERVRVATVREVIAQVRQEQEVPPPSILEGEVVEDARMVASKKLDHLLGQLTVVLNDDTVLDPDESEAALRLLAQLRRTVRERIAS